MYKLFKYICIYISIYAFDIFTYFVSICRTIINTSKMLMQSKDIVFLLLPRMVLERKWEKRKALGCSTACGQ